MEVLLRAVETVVEELLQVNEETHQRKKDIYPGILDDQQEKKLSRDI